jgi:hypothetical protein
MGALVDQAGGLVYEAVLAEYLLDEEHARRVHARVEDHHLSGVRAHELQHEVHHCVVLGGILRELVQLQERARDFEAKL